MRPIFCDLHGRRFRGHGTTQVFRRRLFQLCAACWFNRRHECNDHMKRISS